MEKISLPELGWKAFFQQQLSIDELTDYFPSRVIEQHRSQIITWSEQGEQVFPIGVLNKLDAITVGDWLLVSRETATPVRRLERQSLLQRKAAGTEIDTQLIAANIDTLFIISSCNLDFNLARLERYLVLALDAGVMPVIILTKADLAGDAAQYRQQAEKLRPGLVVECINAFDTSTLTGVLTWCNTGQTIAMLGSSGVGKSTLAAALGVTGRATNTIREDDHKGRHTTTSRSLHRLSQGGLLIDNPGIRELQLTASEEGVNILFADVLDFAQCRFSDCTHTKEPGCGVLNAIETGKLDRRRLLSYQKLLAEQRRNSATLAETRKHMRQQSKTYKRILAESRQRKEKS